MSELIFLVEEDPEGGYTARALGQSIFTEADTLGKLRINIRQAVRCHFEKEDKAPNVIQLHLQPIYYRLTPAQEEACLLAEAVERFVDSHPPKLQAKTLSTASGD